MKNIGTTLMGLGVLAIVLNFINMVPLKLMWIYSWGESTAMMIKIGVIVVGAILYVAGRNSAKKEETNG